MKRTRLVVLMTVTTLLASAGSAFAGGSSPSAQKATSAAQASGDGRQVDELQPADTAPTSGVQRNNNNKLRVAESGPGPATYLIRLAEAPVPSYEGGEPGLAPTSTGGAKLDTSSRSVRAYQGHLVEAQTEFVQRMERTAGHSIEVLHTYQYAVNGIAAVLTAEEAQAIANDPSVISIAPDEVRELHTDVGPQWEGADALWNAVEDLGLPADYKGEGVVIGTIDTGISPGNRSFADEGGDGYDHSNPRGRFYGVCDQANLEQYDPLFPCNDKLIGAYDFIDNGSALDYDGHGSHTASTSGGNVVHGVVVHSATVDTPPFDISGVAPHANIIAYLGCCTLAGLTASIDQAIADEVDVINYSIGSSSASQAWDDFDTLGFLNARAAGIFVATSNGNDGPGDATTGSPADAPWLTSVGASTHNRHNGNALTDLTSTDGSLGDIPGKSVTGSLGPSPIIDASASDDPFCDDTEGHSEYVGKIVVCSRGGVSGRVAKSANVKGQGAVGFVLTNTELHGDSLLGDEYELPGLFITYDDGVALKTWLATGSDHIAAVAGTTFSIDDTKGDIMASFSSRGPNRAVDTIVPSVTAPGVDVLAALTDSEYDGEVYGFISGTSMASPHVAGAGALLTQARPGWSPAQQQSALMTTAFTGVKNHDGQPATPYAQGSGRVDVGRAVMAGLLFDETFDHYMAANPDDGGDPKTLNLPSFANSQCLVICTWDRVATVPSDAEVPAGVTWTASSTSDAGLTLSVELSQATVSPGDELGITVTADVDGAAEGATLFGRITLEPSDPSVPSVTMPVAVVPSSGVLPGGVDVQTRRDAGSQLVTGIQSIGVSEFTGSIAGYVKATQTEAFLDEDATPADPYDNLDGVDIYTVDVAPGSTRLVAEVLEAAMPDLDMYVGTGDTPGADSEVCVSATGSALEHCDVAKPAPGTWWILIQNWEGTTAQPDRYLLARAVVPGDSAGNGSIVGPTGPIAPGDPYDVRVTWDLPASKPGDIWYGTAVLGTSPDSQGDIGSFPVRIERVADDVTKTASVDTAVAGDTIDYDITVQPNITDTDLTYTVVDTVPNGLTIDPKSVTAGGVVNGQTITWKVPMPSAVGVVGDYVASTPDDDPECSAASGFVDLAAFGIGLNTDLDGDTTSIGVFSTIGPFDFYGKQYPGLVVSEDGLITVPGGYAGSPWSPQTIPDVTEPNGVIAPLWSDLQLSVANSRGMRLATSDGVAVVQWDNPFEWGGDPADPTNSVGKFQAWIYTTVDDSRPEITFEYDTVGALPAVATVGIESLDASHATAVVNEDDPSAALEDGGTICLDYIGPKFDPATLSYSAKVNNGVIPGVYTNRAVHVTDDPYAKPVTVSDSVTVNRVCTKTITRTQLGTITVASGTTCITGATVLGKITVKKGASLVIINSSLLGALSTTGAKEVTICNSSMLAVPQVVGSSSVRVGDPKAGCGSNLLLGGFKLTDSVGPSIIGGNLIVGQLACTNNKPAPVNNGSGNSVIGKKTGQCAKL